MNIEQIRQKLTYDPERPLSVKESLRPFMVHLSKDYPVALTLTLKQVITEERHHGTIIYRIKREDCERVAKRFIQKLNREVFGKSAERHSLGLKYLIVLEGDGVSKNFHLHMSIGGLPSHVRFNQMDKLVKNAKSHCDGIDEQHKVDLTDSGWNEYIMKELSKNNTDKILWNLT